jgi:TonB family protein
MIGVRNSMGIHVAALLAILTFCPFSAFQVGEKPSCVTVSLVSPPGKDGGREAMRIEKKEATDEISRQAEDEVVEKTPLVQPQITKIKAKREISFSPKTQSDPDLPAPSSLRRMTHQVDKSAPEHAPEREVQGQRITGEEMHPASSEGRPVTDGSGEFFLRQVDQPPTPTRKIEPEFPLTARRLGIGGKVVVKFLVKTDGNVAKASVVEAEPKEIFEQSALDAVRDWQFIPGRYHGEAVATWVVLPIQFRLTR